MAGKIFYRSDYSNANSTINELSEVQAGLKAASNKITEYVVGSKNILTSESIDPIIKRLNLYADTFKYLGNAIGVTINNSVSSNNSVMNAMQGESFISDDKIDEAKRALAIAKSNYYKLKNKESNEQIATEQIASNLTRAYNQILVCERELNILENILQSTVSADNAGAGNLSEIVTVLSNLRANGFK